MIRCIRVDGVARRRPKRSALFAVKRNYESYCAYLHVHTHNHMYMHASAHWIVFSQLRRRNLLQDPLGLVFGKRRRKPA